MKNVFFVIIFFSCIFILTNVFFIGRWMFFRDKYRMLQKGKVVVQVSKTEEGDILLIGKTNPDEIAFFSDGSVYFFNEDQIILNEELTRVMVFDFTNAYWHRKYNKWIANVRKAIKEADVVRGVQLENIDSNLN